MSRLICGKQSGQNGEWKFDQMLGVIEVVRDNEEGLSSNRMKERDSNQCNALRKDTRMQWN
jgi:hypothetical protein